MNGIHDMGGMTGFGSIIREENEPRFHAQWEGRVLGMVRSTIDVHYNWDEFRSAIERIDPVVYLSASYYERWLTALERFLIEKDAVSDGEIRDRSQGAAPLAGVPSVNVDTVDAAIYDAVAPQFKVGDTVVARPLHPVGHTRTPRYVRGKSGIVERYLGAFILPDARAVGLEVPPQPVYAVRFSARDLWGPQGNERDSVCVDMWEGYLSGRESAGGRQ
ncbi:MAG: nitrile hydratase subunit beta [Chloroflexota bacterium]